MNTPSLNVGSVLQRLKARRANYAKPIEDTVETHASTIVLPPFESQIALISAQRNKWKALFVCAASVGLLASSGLAYFLNHQLFTKMNSDFLIVPGAAEFMRIRPNLIPDAVVFSFAEYVATYAGTFTYRNAKSKRSTRAGFRLLAEGVGFPCPARRTNRWRREERRTRAALSLRSSGRAA